ncbi:type VI secretion system baseplate subunit TssF [Pseudoalteromonas sp. SCSIO 43201]|uniref:type VI secretion system baseplate subunit TssF n=1 Tax=Pseudoalteromonas TaxID=53246 RepID=UPI002074CBEE|nr:MULTISPECIES: type VI secretion system baseplate subunit TssF [Pseudoalteromonas]MDW7551244.1 type VI secretion system baseplate subunit TssF [Pseudoalteromonas peptidolytica]USD28428.1 type VI secretion system baseplate subunit TssF [Pseudoalteromonas sp. SCSIO 43201]
MISRMLKHFEDELASIRYGLEGFRKHFRREAEHINLNDKGQEDPNVTRLIDSFAWVAAKNAMEIDALRTRHVEEFADIVSPNLFKTLPMVVQAHFQPNADDFNKPVFLDKQVEVELDVINKGDDNTTVKLCNSLPVTFSPMSVSRFKLEQTPFQHAVPANLDSKLSPYCLRVELSPLSSDVDMQQALAQPIQLHFSNESIGRNVADIINQAVTNVAICVADDDFAYDVGKGNFHPLLADDDFLISPIDSNEIPAYFKLKEYFSVPAKRQFFILKNPHKLNVGHGKSVFIDFYLNELGAVLLEERNLSVKINKTLFSNLFHQSSEPVRVNYQELSYPVIADASQHHVQIYSIDKVYVVTSQGQQEIPPVVGTQTVDFESQLYWSQSVKLGHIDEANKTASLDEVKHLVLPINKATATYPNGFTAFAQITCYDAQLANKVHVGNQIVVNTEEALAGEFNVGGVTIQPSNVATDEKNYWRLLKLMSFNLSQLLQVEDAKTSLIGFLKLFVNANATHQELNSIYDVCAEKINAPFLVEGRMIFVPGMALTLTLDNSELNADFSLFAELINDFLAAQTPFDRCSQLTVKYTSYNWPAKRFDAQLGARVCS